MRSNIDFLDTIQIAAPCHAAWEDMDGDERTRFCQQCHKNVYNLSEMTRKQAIALVREREGHELCVRFYKRADGTVLTDNCPVGLRPIRNTILRRWAAFSALATVLIQAPKISLAGELPPASGQAGKTTSKQAGKQKHKSTATKKPTGNQAKAASTASHAPTVPSEQAKEAQVTPYKRDGGKPLMGSPAQKLLSQRSDKERGGRAFTGSIGEIF